MWGICGFLFLAGCGKNNTQPPPPNLEGAELSAIAVKIHTLENGVYVLSASDLQSVGIAAKDVDPAYFILSWRGQEWPLWYSRQGSDYSLRFYARASDSVYSAENIYLLRLGDEPGAKTFDWDRTTESEQQDGDASASFYNETFRVEQNQYYFPQVEQGDHWFWQAVPAGQQVEFEVNLDNLVGGPATIWVNIWSGTQSTDDPDHHLLVFVNEQLVHDSTWDGAGWQLLQAEIPEGVLAAGSNRIRLSAPGDTGALAETNLVDWIDIQFPRRPVARDGAIHLESIVGEIVLEGFRDRVAILNITDPLNAYLEAAPVAVNGKVSVWGQTGDVYYAVDTEGLRSPVRLALAQDDQVIFDVALGAEYLAIGPVDLLAPLAPLLEQRAQQGLNVASIPVEAIYDRYNHGFPEPDAIRTFVSSVYQQSEGKLSFLLLVGDASYDPLGYLAPREANRLPTFFVQTVFGGQTASDVLFGDVDGDLLPDIAVGRVPAGSPDQVELFVAKTLAYEHGQASEDGQVRVLAVADGQEESFRQDAQAFLDQLADGYQTDLFSPEAGISGANQTILSKFEDGYGLIAYFGHGSLTMWGKDRLFTVQDVGSLSNSHLPVVINMTCLTGLYTHPTVLSLAETMLWQADGGAVAVLAPSSLTLSYDQGLFNLPLARGLTQGVYTRLGEAYLAAQREMPADSVGARDVLQTFLLFGDPALLLSLPNSSVP